MTAPDPRNPLAGRYIDGVWTCAYCGAELLGEKVFHRPECQFKDDPVTAPDPATLASDSLVNASAPERYWVGPFEDAITELGIRAAAWDVAENDGGNRADLMLEDWEAAGFGDLGIRR